MSCQEQIDLSGFVANELSAFSVLQRGLFENSLNPQVSHGATELGELRFAHLAPLLGREPVGASPGRV
jgi:hypothetical protein